MSAELELAKLEQRTLATAGIKAFLGRVDELRKLLALGDDEAVLKLLAILRPPVVEAQAMAAVLDAYRTGADDALAILEGADLPTVARTGRPSRAARGIVTGLDKAGRDAVKNAAKLARTADAATAAAPVLGHANRVRGSVTDAINRSGNEGTTAIADAAGLPTVWVAETDACVHCLRYSGEVAAPGEVFPGGLTYGRKAYHTEPLGEPPRHPHCRCTVEPLHDDSYADALRREADRSVLRGFSLESEAMSTRIDAADRLLARGVDAPKSVQEYARRAVKRGEFVTRGRPTG